MRNTKRILALVLTLVTLVSTLAVTAFASTEDHAFLFVAHADSYTSLVGYKKEDASPVYFLAFYGPSPLRVKVHGANSATGGTGKNLTVANGVNVTYVTCYVGTDYSIHTDVYEEGYAYARPYVKSSSGSSGKLEGEWSPDSWLTHVDATP